MQYLLNLGFKDVLYICTIIMVMLCVSAKEYPVYDHIVWIILPCLWCLGFVSFSVSDKSQLFKRQIFLFSIGKNT